MKKEFTQILLGIAFLGSALALHAQEQTKVTVVQEIQQEDGTVITLKKQLSTQEALDQYLELIGPGQESKVIVSAPENAEEGEQEAIFFFRRSAQDMEGMQRMTIFADEVEVAFNDDNPPRTYKEEAVKAFLGIYPASAPGNKGVRVSNTVKGKPAAAAGLLANDIILDVGGHASNGTYGLRSALSKLSPGQIVPVSILRNGAPMTLNVTLGERTYARTMFNPDAKPCEVFIGVMLKDNSLIGEGVLVTDIIGQTPAEEYGVEAGDHILALDGVPVNSSSELHIERNKHEPGAAFTLKVARGGQVQDINARFYACETDAPIEEPAEVPLPGKGEGQLNAPYNALQLQGFNAFPNPSFGQVRVQFEGEAVPTTVQITDATGRVVYSNEQNAFNGRFDEEVSLRNAAPGTLILTVRQGDEVFSKALLLVNRV